ncbi:MAG: hypothetical protein RL536_541 [Candidatus Parcubacteria bacterium]|jgi:TatD DNase family protein
MNIKYIDIHGHINFPEYDTDREEVIKRAQEAEVGMITVGVGQKSSEKAVQLAETHENIWAIVGIHPVDTNKENAHLEFESVKGLARHPKVVAIGECGLDYFHSKPEDMARQRELFLRHIELANEAGKPLMLHVRNGKSTISNSNNAYQEAIILLKKHAKVQANFHFFAGTLQDSKNIVEMGNTMSFTGVLTFARNYDEVIRNTPLENIMSETDCPFVAPAPYRGKRNEPSYVMEVTKKIAEIRGESLNNVSGQIMENTRRMFSLPASF